MASQSLADKAMAAFVSQGGATPRSLADLAFAADQLPIVPGKEVGEAHNGVVVGNSAVEGTLIQQALPVGLLVPGDSMLLLAHGDLTFGVVGTLTWRLKIGATTILATPAIAYANGANAMRWMLAANIMIEATALQRVGALLSFSQLTAASWDMVNANSQMVGYGSAAEDLSVAKNLLVTNQFGAADPTLTNTCRFFSMTLHKK